MMKGILIAFFCVALILCSSGASINKRDLPSLEAVLLTNFSNFAAALNRTNPALWQRLINATAPDNEYTIFAPTNGAFNGNLTLDQTYYHVTPNYIGYQNLKPYFTRPTLYVSPGLNNTAQVIAFSPANNNTLLVNGITVIATDYPASNGNVIPIANPLTIPVNSVRDIASNSRFSQFSALLARLPNTTLVLNDITLFIPNDDAFNTLFNSTPILRNYLFNAPISQVAGNLAAIFNNHLGSGAVYPNSLVAGQNNSFPTFEGNTLNVYLPANFPNSSITINGIASVTSPNNLATNGVVHEINSVLVPSQFNLNLLGLLTTLNATSFIGALNAYNLSSYLNETEGIHTLFVPTNQALQGVTVNASILLYHIAQAINVSFTNNTVLSQLTLASLAGNNQRLYVSSNRTGNFVNGIQVASPAFTTTSGTTVYLLNHPISLPADALTTLQSAPDNSDFYGLLMERAADGYHNYNSPNVTIFAPNANAFAELPPGMIGYWRLNTSMENSLNAKQVIDNHIVPNNAIYRFPDGNTSLTTAQGVVYAFNPASGPVTVNGQNISSVPLLASNGVIYPINGFLLPSNYSLNALQILQGLAEEENVYGNYTRFINAMQASDQLDVLTGQEATIFAPSDEAFNNVAGLTDLFGVNDTARLHEILNYHIIYGQQIVGLNDSEVFRVGMQTNNTIAVTGHNSQGQPQIALYFPGSNDTQGSATVKVQTFGRNTRIYGIDTVLGVPQVSHSSGLSTLEWVLIGIGGAILGLLLLAAVAGAAYYLLLRPKSGYRKIN